MPSVPQYQRRVFASSAVGTPGVDTSTADVLGEVAASSQRSAATVDRFSSALGSSGQLQARAVQSMTKAGVDLFTKINEIRAADAKKKQLLDNFAVTKEELYFTNDVKKLVGEIKDEHRDRPTGAADTFLNRFQGLLTDRMEAIDDARVRQKFGERANNAAATIVGQLHNWSDTQEVANVSTDLENMKQAQVDKIMAIEPNPINPMASLFEYLDIRGMLEGSINKNVGLFGEEKTKKIVADYRKALDDTFLYQMIQKAPIELYAFSKTDEFKKYFPNADKEDIQEKAKKADEAMRERIHWEDKIRVVTEDITSFAAVENGVVNVQMLQQYRDRAVVADDQRKVKYYDNLIERAVTRAQPKNAPSDRATVRELYAKLDSVFTREGGTKLKVTDEASLAEIADFYYWAADMQRIGRLNDDSNISDMMKLAQEAMLIRSANEENKFGFLGLKGPGGPVESKMFNNMNFPDWYTVGYRYLQGFMEDQLEGITDEERTRLQAVYFPKFLEQMFAYRDLGGEVNENSVIDIAQKIQTDIANDFNSGTALYKNGSWVNTQIGMLMVKSRRPDGQLDFYTPGTEPKQMK